MYIDEKREQLQKLTKRKITYEELAAILGLGSKQAVQNRITRKQELKEWEILALDAAFTSEVNNNNLYVNPKSTQTTSDKIEIPYWPELPDKFKNPKIRSVWFDREVIENKWFVNPEKLFIIPMLGDALSTYWYRINDGDLLIIDTDHNEVIEPAIYFATSRNNTMYWIREIDILANDIVEFHRYTQGGKIVKTYNREELKNLDFKVIGQIIKNISFRI